MPKSVLILAGAPEYGHLDWSSPALLTELNPALARFIDLPASSRAAVPSTSSTTPAHAAWRSIPLQRSHVTTGFSQQHELQFLEHIRSSAQFLTTAAASFEGSVEPATCAEAIDDKVLSQFYEYSLAIYDDIASSQLILSSAEATQDTSSLSNGTSFPSTQDARLDAAAPPPAAEGHGHLSDLEDIPNATYLNSINPQTMTVNIIVGIISLARPRTVKTRWGSTKSLVEVLVGDDTRSGFAVTFWLPSDTVDGSVLASLRPQDVVLIRNVALHVFMKRVYGSSLRKDLTQVHLLYRRKLDAADRGGHYSPADLLSSSTAHPQLEKTKRVRDWVLNFVRQDAQEGRVKTGRARNWEVPPADDTQ